MVSFTLPEPITPPDGAFLEHACVTWENLSCYNKGALAGQSVHTSWFEICLVLLFCLYLGYLLKGSEAFLKEKFEHLSLPWVFKISSAAILVYGFFARVRTGYLLFTEWLFIAGVVWISMW